MTYPWHMFNVWFEDGYCGVFQGAGPTLTEALFELVKGFGDDDELMDYLRRHGQVVKVELVKGK